MKVKVWLGKQALWQVHIPPPKRIDHPHYYVTEVNQMRQADLLYLSHDLVYQNTYKYTLNVIDVASRYKASRPLKTKKASEVEEMSNSKHRTTWKSFFSNFVFTKFSLQMLAEIFKILGLSLIHI